MFATVDNATTINLGPVERIPMGEGRDFLIGAEEIAVFRTRNNKVFAVQAKCSHRNGPLADGITGGSIVVCPMHSYKFDLATGKAIGSDCEALQTYQVELNANEEMILMLGDLGKGVN